MLDFTLWGVEEATQTSMTEQFLKTESNTSLNQKIQFGPIKKT